MLARHLKHRHSWIIAGCFRFGKGSSKNCKVFPGSVSVGPAAAVRPPDAGARRRSEVNSPSMPRRTASRWTPWGCCWTRSRSCWRNPSSRSCSFRRSCSSRELSSWLQEQGAAAPVAAAAAVPPVAVVPPIAAPRAAAVFADDAATHRADAAARASRGVGDLHNAAVARRTGHIQNLPVSPSVPILWIGIGEKIFPPIHPMHRRKVAIMEMEKRTSGGLAMERLNKLKERLEKIGYTAKVFATGEEAKAYLLSAIPTTDTVGVGGSMTVQQLGLAEALRARPAGLLALGRARRPGGGDAPPGLYRGHLPLLRQRDPARRPHRQHRRLRQPPGRHALRPQEGLHDRGRKTSSPTPWTRPWTASRTSPARATPSA